MSDDRHIRCPYCGNTLEVVLEYTGYAYSEHRDHTGFACDNWRCDAKWDATGNVTQQPRNLAVTAE